MAKASDPWKNVLRQAATDPAYRRRLKSKPAQVLAEAGIKEAKGVEYIVVEQTAKKRYIVLPPLAEKGELSNQALDAVVAAGVSYSPKNRDDGPPE